MAVFPILKKFIFRWNIFNSYYFSQSVRISEVVLVKLHSLTVSDTFVDSPL